MSHHLALERQFWLRARGVAQQPPHHTARHPCRQTFVGLWLAMSATNHSATTPHPPPTVPTSKSRVLVLAREPVIAAFLAMLMELDGYVAEFAKPGERAEDAIARLRPPLVICADGALPEVSSDLFLARAAKRGRVVLFAAGAISAEVRELAARRGFPFFALPVDRDTLARALEGAVAT